MNAAREDWRDAWHFTDATLRDGSTIPKDREVLTYHGPVVMCQSGLHASERVIDALQYAPGSTVCRVDVRVIDTQPDKVVGDARVILWRIDAEQVLRAFARKQALSVAHLWDMPEIVRHYLETGDDTARDAAWAAARDAAWAAAQDAARAAAQDAAWAAAQDAARAAAQDAAWAAARAAAWVAAWDAVWAAARAAAWAAARAAAWAAANTMLTEMIEAEARAQGISV